MQVSLLIAVTEKKSVVIGQIYLIINIVRAVIAQTNFSIMKSYKNVEMFAKNSPAGAYAAGCPTLWAQGDSRGGDSRYCQTCERSM